MSLRELVDGEEIDQVLLVRERELRSRRDGSEFLKLSLGDRTGCLPAVVWDGVTAIAAVCEAGAAVRVGGRYAVHPKWGPQLAIRSLRARSPASTSWPSSSTAPGGPRR